MDRCAHWKALLEQLLLPSMPLWTDCTRNTILLCKDKGFCTLKHRMEAGDVESKIG